MHAQGLRRVLYIKGGRALDEGARLFPRVGERLIGGPDKYLLGVLAVAMRETFQLVSFGPVTRKQIFGDREAVEYGLRPSGGGRLRKRFTYAAGCMRFLSETVRWRPTHVLCGLDGPFALFALLAARFSGADFLFLVHTALDLPAVRGLHRLCHRIACRFADRVVVHGPFLKDQALACGANPRDLIEFNNGLDEDRAEQVAQLRECNPDLITPVFMYVGRIEENKGVFDLLNAFCTARLPGARLHFYGKGGAEAALQARIEVLGAGSVVSLFGHVPHTQIFEIMARAAAVVTPTRAEFPEGRCMTVMEALYVGTPVIAPEFGPFPYLVRHLGNGLLYRPDDVTALAKAIGRVASDPQLYDNLRQGARNDGKALMNPDKDFISAIEEALV